MASPYRDGKEEEQPLNRESRFHEDRRNSQDSTSSSDTSIALESLNQDGTAVLNGNSKAPAWKRKIRRQSGDDYDEEDTFYRPSIDSAASKRSRRIIWLLASLCIGGWVLALLLFLKRQTYKHASSIPYDPSATVSYGSGKAVTLDAVLAGQWNARHQPASWIAGANGEDGLLLERGVAGKEFLVVEDVRQSKPNTEALPTQVLMKESKFNAYGRDRESQKEWPSASLKKVLVMTEQQKNWRHSYTGLYWIFDVDTQEAEALDPQDATTPVQLASWSPQSDAVVFTRDNNLFIRKLASKQVTQITKDGGTNLFYGIPDWVYEEEVFSGNSATWWAEDGKYVAFLRTNETEVPQYPIQYYVSRPSGEKPQPGLGSYPETKKIKYPKAGAPNPVVDMQFYDVEKDEVFAVQTDSDFPDDDRLITEVIWAGSEGKAIIKNTNRVSDILKVALIDVKERTGSIVREDNVQALDGGWFEVSENTKFIPADPANGRPHSGYIDTVVHEGFDHMAYFTPLDNPDPIMLTSGEWEVVDAPSGIDLAANMVYFVGTKESSLQRHVYNVNLDGSGLSHISNSAEEGYYSVQFSTGVGFALLNYDGPDIPWQEIRSTPSYKGHLWQFSLEQNTELSDLAAAHELPIKLYQTLQIDGIDFNFVERRPPHFDENKQYPVLFYLYAGPGSQLVDKKFTVDFQSYVASNLGYIVVTIDGRGTGYLGRKARTVVRDNLGHYEALDQIAAAKMFTAKSYVDSDRVAIWGWSYGGFMTLKTLELDGGETFKYGMAVAPVTDWSFYDSIYTERYMRTPQDNPKGYTSSAITNVSALQQNVRFLMMHGVADDNVHLQNPLTLLDKFDMAGIENYDVHFFPDSDHSISFHNANRIVYHKLSKWLVNAFNGEWLRTEDVRPKGEIGPGDIED